MVRIRRGSQVPTFSTVGAWHHTDGPYVISMFESYGVRFYESQKYEMDVYMARDAMYEYAAITICVTKPRQNGKSFAARYYSLYMAAVCGKRVLYSAHNGDTAREMFKALRGFIEGQPDFMDALKPNRQGFYAAKGSEGIYFVDENGRDGGCIEFQTRTTSGGRGKTYDIIIVDEAQELTEEHLAAIKPTTFASAPVDEQGSGVQMIFLGTPPNGKCMGTVFRDYHDRAHGDPSTSIWWMEWAVKEIPDMTDRDSVMELVYLTNPAMGYRIKESTMLDAMDTMSADTFACEALGWWTPIRTDVHRVIGKACWDECRINVCDQPNEGTYVMAVKFEVERGSYGIVSVCVAPDDGVPYVEVAEKFGTGDGIGPFVSYLTRASDAVDYIVIDGKGLAQTLYEELLANGVDEDVLVRPTTAEAISAYSGFADAAKSRKIAHSGQQGANDAAYGCLYRPIGKEGGYGYQSDADADATILDTFALAHHWALVARREPKVEMLYA